MRKIEHLVATVVPHFREFPLMSSKQRDFERFAGICEVVSAAKHLEQSCFEGIVRLAMDMNPSGKRKYLAAEILKSLDSPQRTVCDANYVEA